MRYIIALILMALPSLAWAQAAIRPDQIQPGTPNMTMGVIGNTFQIGTTRPWRTDSTASPTFTSADNGKLVELTFSGTISATLPDATGATGAFADGTGFMIQVGPGTLSLIHANTSTIGGLTGISVGPYQAVSLRSKGSNWYAAVSVPPTGPVVVGGSVWNPGDKAASMPALSTTTIANDTAATSTTAGWAAVRGTQSYACCSGGSKRVFTLGVVSADNNGWLGGVGDGSVTLSYPGNFSHGYGVQATATTGITNDYQDGNGGTGGTTTCSVIGTPGSGTARFTNGTVMWLAIDFSTGKVFCSLDCNTWVYNSAGTGPDDAAAVPTATLTPATYFPMWGGTYTSVVNKAVLNTKPTIATGCTKLTSFLQWG